MIIDEVSMIVQKFLAACVQKAKAVHDSTISFGRLNVIFAGDFMQLPPVQDPALYEPNEITGVSMTADKQTHAVR